MRTPMPIPVQATFVSPPAEDDRIDTVFDQDDDSDLNDEDFSGSEDSDAEDASDDEDEEEEKAKSREVASDNAPWSPVPLRLARELVKLDADAGIDVVFPTVYEEDRSAKLKDLITSQAAGIITHQRMSEQAAKELGFESYVYAQELALILAEMKKLPPALLGAADAIAGATKGGGGSGGGGISIGAPAAGITSERRGDVSGDSKHDFRRDQRSMVSTTDETDQLSESRKLTDTLIRALEAIAANAQQGEGARVEQHVALREAMRATHAIAESVMRLAESITKQPAPVASDVNVTSPIEVAAPHIEIKVPEQPAPIVNVTIAGGKVTKTVQRDEHGRVSGVTEEPAPVE